jgi:hypothetical protein
MGLRDILVKWLWRAFLFITGAAMVIYVIVLIFEISGNKNILEMPLLFNPYVYLATILITDGALLMLYAAGYDVTNYNRKSTINYLDKNPLLWSRNELPSDFDTESKTSIRESISFLIVALIVWPIIAILAVALTIILITICNAFHIDIRK